MATRLPPLNALVVFEAAARHLSFTRAADSLHVTQAAVSHQIKALEEWLGVPLFHRVGRGKGLALTEAGRTYLPRINAALESIRSATSAVMDKRRQRVLNVATLDSFGLLWLLPRLRRFLGRNPGIDVRILAADLDDDALAMGEVDIDLRYGEGDWPGLQVVRFMTEVIFPVCSPRVITRDRPLDSPSDLKHHTLLHDVLTVDWRTWIEAAGVTGINVDTRSRIQSLASGDGCGDQRRRRGARPRRAGHGRDRARRAAQAVRPVAALLVRVLRGVFARLGG